MPLQLNTIAPHFVCNDIYGRNIDLNDYKNKKLFIGFFRHAGCPFCNIRVHFLKKNYETLKAKGLEMIFFFESSQAILTQSIFHQEVSPIPLISDPEKIIYQKYGLQPSTSKAIISHLSSFVQTAFKASREGVPLHLMAENESFSTMPAEFLINKGLIINKILYSDRLNERLKIETINEFAHQN